MKIIKPILRNNILVFRLQMTSLILIFIQVILLTIIRNYDFPFVCQTGGWCSNLVSMLGESNNLAFLIISFLSLAVLFAGIATIYLGWKKNLYNIRLALLGIFTISLVIAGWAVSRSEVTNKDIISNLIGMAAIFSSSFWLGLFVFRKKVAAISKKIHWVFISWSLFSLLVLIMGVIVSVTDAGKFCIGYPFCNSIGALEPLGYLALVHRLLTAILIVVSIMVLNLTWKYYRSSYFMLISVTSAFTMLIGQIVVGAQQVVRNFPLDLVTLHAISSSGYLVWLIFALIASRYETPTEVAHRKTIFNDRGRLKDFYLLNKPIIVLLLLVTTYSGMVVSVGRLPSLSLTFWTMLAGALAAGGSSAINQYIDREIDLSMQRTAKRPLPSGRLMPSEALALGAAEIVISFFIYASFVNMLAAILAMIGMIYYVFLYSLWLKHATVQNIVIGGGAGAIPPLVGWAAATGSLNIPSLFLFALVFLWTPPHFWALALVRKNDYARAKVPMLPVINGEKTTRLQIFIYTIQLVILTLVMPFFDLGGSIYLVAAIALGLWLLHTAWRVLTVEGNKVAYKMYRYSSMYLAFIFLALTVDSLL